jgi:hypothetical protein
MRKKRRRSSSKAPARRHIQDEPIRVEVIVREDIEGKLPARPARQ